MTWLHKQDSQLGDITYFAHESTDILGVNGRPWFDLTHTVDLDYQRMDDEICMYLSQADLSQLPMTNGQMPPSLRISDKTFEHEYLYNLQDEHLKTLIADWHYNRRRKYLFFKNKIIQPWNFIVTLKPNEFVSKCEDLFPWIEDMDTHLPYTKSAILQMPFDAIGRVVIYGSWPETTVPCHRDAVPQAFNEHHINLNPGGYRPVYLYDSNRNIKNYLPKSHKLYAFNTTDYHGVDAMDRFSYIVRIDGRYRSGVLS
jgi:hypothetical protein